MLVEKATLLRSFHLNSTKLLCFFSDIICWCVKKDKVIKSTAAKFLEANASKKKGKPFVPELLPFSFLLLLFARLCRTANTVSARQGDCWQALSRAWSQWEVMFLSQGAASQAIEECFCPCLETPRKTHLYLSHFVSYENTESSGKPTFAAASSCEYYSGWIVLSSRLKVESFGKRKPR